MKNARIFAIFLSLIFLLTACNVTSSNDVKATKTPESAKSVKAETKEKPQPAATPKEELVLVVDGREERTEEDATEAETKFVSKEFKQNETAIMKKSQFQCDDGTAEGVTIIETAKGSFTKPNSSQNIYLYERCRAGRAFGVGGILIAENDKTVAHHTYGENGLDAGIAFLADVNKNGLSEVVIFSNGSGQGYLNSAIYLFEMKDGNMNYLGNATIYTDNSGAMEDSSKIETNAYKISVQPAETPIFYREHYQQKGGANKWSLVKKSEKFSLDKADHGKYHRIN